MDAYAEGFLKAIEVVRDYSLATEVKDMMYQKLYNTTRLELIEGLPKLLLKHLENYYEKEIKNGVRN